MVTIALRVSSVASFLAVEPSVHPPQLKPMIIVAIAPTAAPCSSRFSDSPCRIAGNCTEFPFADMEAHLLHQSGVACPPVSSGRSWAQILGRYRKPSHARSIIEIAITFGPLSGLWVLAWAALYLGHCWLCLLLAIPAAGFVVRLFMASCGRHVTYRHAAVHKPIIFITRAHCTEPY